MPSAPGKTWLGREEISVFRDAYSSGLGVEAGGGGTGGVREVVNESEMHDGPSRSSSIE